MFADLKMDDFELENSVWNSLIMVQNLEFLILKSKNVEFCVAV